tara:strand:+ start:9271 stop:9687 length:417 start_codon:yes stop_codon:yes gene_type:complete
MEEEFYGTVKLISGEEIFAEILPVKEDNRTLLLLTEPVQVQTVSVGSDGLEGVKIDPWIKTQSDSMIVIDMDKVITVLEAEETGDMVKAYRKYLRARGKVPNRTQVTKKMGLAGSVQKHRLLLEKIYNNSAASNTESD